MRPRRGLEGQRQHRRHAVVINNSCPPNDAFTFAPSGAKRVISVGRLDWQKGFDVLIDAFSRIADDHPGATLTIFGEGQEREALERLVQHRGMDHRIRLPGTTQQPGAWIAQADILVLSSRHEGFSNVLAEATVAGIPSIATNCDYGPDEIIFDMQNGMLVPVDDVAALAGAITKLLSDPELQNRFTKAAEITGSG